MLDRKGLAKLPAVEWRRDVIRGIIRRQAGAILLCAAAAAVLSSDMWSLIILGAVIVGGFVFSALAMGWAMRREGRLSTRAALEFGTELVGKDANAELDELSSRFSACLGCRRPRLFSLPTGHDDVSPGAMWLDGRQPCIALSAALLADCPHLVKFTLAHEVAHIYLRDRLARTWAMIGNIATLNAALGTALWAVWTLVWAHAVGVGMVEFVVRLMALFGASVLFAWLWKRTNVWLGWVMQVSEYAADAVGAALVGSRAETAAALHALALAFGGPFSLFETDQSHPSVADRVRELIGG